MRDYLDDILGPSPWSLTWKAVILRLGLGCMGLLAVIAVCITCLLIAALHVTHGV